MLKCVVGPDSEADVIIAIEADHNGDKVDRLSLMRGESIYKADLDHLFCHLNSANTPLILVEVSDFRISVRSHAAHGEPFNLKRGRVAWSATMSILTRAIGRDVS